MTQPSAQRNDAKGQAGDAAAPKPRNYITPVGHQRLKDELLRLIDIERPEVVRVVSWAASNGDRSENGDYIYGKKRLREIDRRIRFLTKRLELAEVVDNSGRDTDQVFFGATVTYANEEGEETTVVIVGTDEVNLDIGHVSWVSPVARALIKARLGDSVALQTPAGRQMIDILEVRYLPIDTRIISAPLDDETADGSADDTVDDAGVQPS